MAVVNPTPANANSVHVDSALTDFATAYENRFMVADVLSPIVKVDKRSDVFHKRTRRDTSHVVKDLIGPKSRANETTYETTTGSYTVQDRGLMDYVDYAMIDNADAALSPEEETVNDLMTKLMLAREVRIAAQYCSTSSYASGNYAAATAVWSNESTGKPILDINTGLAALPPGGPGSRLVAWAALEVWNALRSHPSILGLKGLKEGMLSKQEFATYFGVDEMVVTDAQKDTNNRGQDPSYSRIWTATQFGLARVPVAPSRRTSAFAVTFRVNPGIETTTWEEPGLGVKGCKAIRTTFSDDEVISQNDMAYLITGCL